MPTKPKRACPGRGPRYNSCRNVIGSHERYCGVCLAYIKRETAKYDRDRDETAERQWIHSPRWRRESKTHLDAHPLCVPCEKEGRTTAAYLVDHIIPHEGNYELFWDHNNWQSLCNDCHEIKHGPDRWGKNRVIDHSKGGERG